MCAKPWVAARFSFRSLWSGFPSVCFLFITLYATAEGQGPQYNKISNSFQESHDLMSSVSLTEGAHAWLSPHCCHHIQLYLVNAKASVSCFSQRTEQSVLCKLLMQQQLHWRPNKRLRSAEPHMQSKGTLAMSSPFAAECWGERETAPGKRPGWSESSGSQPHKLSRRPGDTGASASPRGSRQGGATLQHVQPADEGL